MANPRFVGQNHIFNGAILTASSELNGFGVSALEDQLRQYYWRTATGWTVVADFNDDIDFDRGGVKLATIAPGHYETPALYAAAVVAALEAADATPVWACVYDAGTKRFTISTSAHSFELLWASGANVATSAGRDLSFVPLDANGELDPGDTGSATSHAGTIGVYQSRHFLEIELTAEQFFTIGTRCAVLLDANLTSTALTHSVKLQSSATPSWASPLTNVQMNAVNNGGNPRRIYFSDPFDTYWRLYVDDVTNPDGYFQLGKLILGPYVESPYCFSVNQSRQPEDFSTVTVGIDGTHFHTRRRKRAVWNLEIVHVPEGPSLNLLHDFLEDLAVGDNIILDKDPGLNTIDGRDEVFYGYFGSQPSEQFVPNPYWTFAFPFIEAL